MVLKTMRVFSVPLKKNLVCHQKNLRNYLQESRRQSLNSAAPYQTIRALLRHTAYQCELHFRKDLNVVIRLI